MESEKFYKDVSKKAPTFREEMNCEMFNNPYNIMKSVPTDSRELTPDKLSKKSVRWSKTSGLYDGGTVDEAGTSNPSGVRGCQQMHTTLLKKMKRIVWQR